MLKENEIINLLKESLRHYITCLERSDFDYLEFKGQIIACLTVLNREDLQVKYLDMSKAKELLKRI